jgi:hypothetical protein
MANQTIEPQPGDVADERGKFAPEATPGDPVMIPEPGVDAVARHGSSDDGPPKGRYGTQGAAIEDLADPDADANFPDPSKPIAMGVGSQPDRGRDVPGGGYGDSRDAGGAAIHDEEGDADSGAEGEIRSGSHVSEDDTRGTPSGSRSPAEHPDVSQPANVNQPRRP